MNTEVRHKTRQALKAAGMTQRDLAAATGIHPNNISRMFRDGGVGTTPENWQKVLDALGLTLTVTPAPQAGAEATGGEE